MVDFRSIVLIMTSNVGTSTIDTGIGMGLGRSGEDRDAESHDA